MPALTAGQLTALRAQPPTSKSYLAILAPQINSVFVGVVTAYTNTPVAPFIVVTTTSGAIANILPGMTLWAGIAADDYSYGRIRVKSASSNDIFLAENSEIPFAIGTTVSVYAEYLPWVKLPYISTTGTIAKDNDIFLAPSGNQQTKLTPPVAMMGSDAVGIIVGGIAYVYFDGVTSYATAPGASILTYAWVFPGGTPSTYSGYTPGYVSFNSVGVVYCTLTVTDSNGIASKTERAVLIIDPLASPYPYYAYTAFEITKLTGDIDTGFTASFKVSGVSDKTYFPEGARVLLYSDDSYGGTKNQVYGPQGPKAGGTFANVGLGGASTWINPSNAQVLDGVLATSFLTNAGDWTDYLFASNFGFTVPSTASITGVTARVVCDSVGPGVSDFRVRLFVAGVASGTDNAHYTWVNGVLTNQVYPFGGAINSLWGLALTPAIINAANFGIGIAAQMPATINKQAQIDYIEMTVYYYDDTGIGFESHRTNVKYDGFLLDDTITIDPQTSEVSFDTGSVAHVLALQYMRPTFVQDKALITSTLPTGLSVYYRLEEASGNRIDSFGGADLTPNGSPLPGNVVGVVGNALSLVAANLQYLSHADTAALRHGGNPFWWEGWVKLTDKLAPYALVSKYAAGNREYLIQYDNGGDRFQFTSSSDGTATTTAVANTFGSPTAGVWYYLSCRYDGTKIYISVNNGAENSAALVITFAGGTAALNIGRLPAGVQYANAMLDEWGFWHKSPTVAEITAQYNSGNGDTYPFSPLSPATWSEAYALTIRRAILYLIYWHSTLMEICDVYIEADSTPVQIADFPKANFWDMLRNYVSSTRMMHAGVTKNGRVEIRIDLQAMTLTQRNAAPVVMQLQASDWQGQVQINESPLNDVAFLDESGVWYEGNPLAAPIPIFSKAPGFTPATYGRDLAIQYLATTGQLDMNVLAGQVYQWRNNNYKNVVIKMAGNWVSAFDPAYQEYVTAPSAGFPSNRGAQLANARLMLRQASISFANAGGYWTSTLTFEVEAPTTPIGVIGDYPPGALAAGAEACPLGAVWNRTTRVCDILGTTPSQYPWANTWRSTVIVATKLKGVFITNNFSGPTGTMPLWSNMNARLVDYNGRLPQIASMTHDPYNPSFLYLTDNGIGVGNFLWRFNPLLGYWEFLTTASALATLKGVAGTTAARFDVLMQDWMMGPGYLGVFIVNVESTNYSTYFFESTDYGSTWSAGVKVGASTGIGKSQGVLQRLGVVGRFAGASATAVTNMMYCPLETDRPNGKSNLFKSVNRGASWASTGVTDPTYNFEHGTFWIDPSDHDVIWYGEDNIYQFTAQGGAVATKLAGVGPHNVLAPSLSYKYALSVLYNPSGHAQTIRTFDAKDVTHKARLYTTTNEGASWTSQDGTALNVTAYPFGVVEIWDSAGLLYAVASNSPSTADHVVYVSSDSGATWIGRSGTAAGIATPGDGTGIPYDAGGVVDIVIPWNV